MANAPLCVPTTNVLSCAALFCRSMVRPDQRAAVEEVGDRPEIVFERVAVDLGVLGHGDQHPVSPLRRTVLFRMMAPLLASKKIPLRPLSSTRLPSMSAPGLPLSYQMPSAWL